MTNQFDTQSDFDGVPTNPDRSIRAHEPTLRAVMAEMDRLVVNLEAHDWVDRVEDRGFYSVAVWLDSAVFESVVFKEALEGRDYRVRRVDFADRKVELEILEWEALQE